MYRELADRLQSEYDTDLETIDWVIQKCGLYYHQCAAMLNRRGVKQKKNDISHTTVVTMEKDDLKITRIMNATELERSVWQEEKHLNQGVKNMQKIDMIMDMVNAEKARLKELEAKKAFMESERVRHMREREMKELLNDSDLYGEDIHGENKNWEEVVTDSRLDDLMEEITRTILIIQENECLHDKLIEEYSRCTLSVECGSHTIAVAWNLEDIQPASESDWIGLFKEGDKDKNYLNYISTKGQTSGMDFITSPINPGLYQFRFMPQGFYKSVAFSDTIYIGPEIELTLSYEGDYFIGKWTLVSGDVTENDWFGLYRVGANNKNYIRYFRLNKKKKFMLFDFVLSQGEYELRYFPYQCGYTPVASSNQIKVEGDDRLYIDYEYDAHNRIKSIIVTPNIQSSITLTSDWMGLYNTKSESYEKYKYIGNQNSVSFPGPKVAGNYQCRYFSSATTRNQEIVRSEIFPIENTDSLTVENKEGYLVVEWDIDSQPTSSYDWLGLYSITEPNNRQYIQCSYINPSKQSEVYPLPTTPGLYEFRYFSAAIGRYTDFLKSNTIKI